MATIEAKRSESRALDELPRPLIPLLSARLRLALVGGLILWQLVSLWLVPFFNSWNLPRDIESSMGGWFVQEPPSPIAESISAGVMIAICGNAAFIFAKAPWHWPARILVGSFLLATAILGYLQAFGEDTELSRYSFHPVAIGLAICALLTAVWRCARGASGLGLIHLEDADKKKFQPTSQFGLIHLLLLMVVSAFLVSMYRWVGPVRFRIFFFSMQPNHQLALLELILLALLTTFSIHLAALQVSRLWLLAAVGLVVMLIAAILPAADWLHGLGIPYRFYAMLFAAQAIFLTGTGLAMRLLGYRLATL